MGLGQAGGRLGPPATGPPDAATDCVPARLHGLAGSGRLCLEVQVTESGAGRQRAGPLRTTRDVQRWAHRRAVDSAEVAG
eukprot:5200864-Alexandrium_andersonii.AAC.1